MTIASKIQRMGGHPNWVSSTQRSFLAWCSTSKFVIPATSALKSSSTSSENRWRFSVLVLLLPCAATFGLGSWQLVRRQWKVDLLDHRRKRLEEEPISVLNALAATTVDSATPPTLEFRKVFCEGVYDDRKSLFVGPRAKSAFGATHTGYYLITPLIVKDRDSSLQVPVLVNRGWVPSSWREEFDRVQDGSCAQTADEKKIDHALAEDHTHGRGTWWKLWGKNRNPQDTSKENAPPQKIVTVKVCGVIRDSEQPNMFVPSNVPEAGQWFYIDVSAMAGAVGLPENTILIEVMEQKSKFEDANKSEVYPATKDPDALLRASVMPADHMNYALTWYSLSAATTFMTIKRLQGARKGF